MKKVIFLIFFLITSVFASDFKQPIGSFISSGFVIDLLYKDSKVYSATDAGTVDIFDFKTKKIVKKIKVPKIKDFMGDLVDSKVFSVDEYEGEIMILSQAQKGFSRIHLHRNSKTTLLIDYTKNQVS